MENKVYLLFREYGYDGGTVLLGVYSDLDKAIEEREAYLEYRQVNPNFLDDVHIQDIELGSRTLNF